MTRRLFIALFVVVLLMGKGDTAVITDGPSNAVVKLGGQAIFNCTSSITLQNWILAKNRNDLVTPSAQNIAVKCAIQAGFETYYEVDRPGGDDHKCNLIVKTTTMQQAGTYTCSDSALGPSAILTVIEGDPILTYKATEKEVKEQENVDFECSLNYNGSTTPAPQLQPYFNWTNSSGQSVPIYSNSSTDSTAVSQLTVTAGRQDIPSYTCHVYFQLTPPITAGYATNTPTINSNASSPIIEVRYAPSTPAITSEPVVIAIDGVPCGISILNCSSAGNPIPTYRWYDSVMNILDTTSTLTLAEINRYYRCEANNTIGTTSTYHNVSQDNCSSSVECCVFPHDDTTTANRKGCDNGKLCDCSENKSGITLFCNVTTFPNASYIWSGPGGITFGPTDSPVYDQVSANGKYECTAYFNKSSSNYSGGVDFPNGTGSIPVNECSDHLYCYKFKKRYVCIIVIILPICVVLAVIVFFAIRHIWNAGPHQGQQPELPQGQQAGPDQGQPGELPQGQQAGPDQGQPGGTAIEPTTWTAIEPTTYSASQSTTDAALQTTAEPPPQPTIGKALAVLTLRPVDREGIGLKRKKQPTTTQGVILEMLHSPKNTTG